MNILIFIFPKKIILKYLQRFKKKEDTTYNAVKVLTQPLDEVVKDFDSISNPFTLWIDVEGFQKQVLFGAKNVLSNKNCKFLKIEVEEVEKFKGQLFLKEEIEEFLYEYNFIPVFRDFEYDYQFNVLFIKKEYYSEVSDQINLSINESISNSINLYKVLSLISDKKNFISEMKNLTIRLLGKKFGNYLATLLGSKSSKAFLKRDKKNSKI